jgi:hypothetical protein
MTGAFYCQTHSFLPSATDQEKALDHEGPDEFSRNLKEMTQGWVDAGCTTQKLRAIQAKAYSLGKSQCLNDDAKNPFSDLSNSIEYHAWYKGWLSCPNANHEKYLREHPAER